MSLAIRPSAVGARPWRRLDIALVASVLSLSGIGSLMVYSSTRLSQANAGLDATQYLKRQLLFIAMGAGAMVLAAAVDYRALRDSAAVLWVGTLVALLLVLTPLGSTTRGHQAWFQVGPFSLQPSEVAKVVVILVLSAYLATQRGELGSAQIATALALAAVPMTLILVQPDLGTDLVFVAVIMGLLLVGGAAPRQIAVLTAVSGVAVVAVFQLGLLKQYQHDRLTAFLDPSADTQRASYNLHQSQIAIGAGGLTGKGLYQGTQTNLSFVPEQHTDFIFTAVGEELGFAGAATVLGLFAVLMWRIWRTAALATDPFARLICVGVLAMLVFQVFENVGMTMGITPIIGIPLPFVSYGGSSMLACFVSVGVVLNVGMGHIG